MVCVLSTIFIIVGLASKYKLRTELREVNLLFY